MTDSDLYPNENWTFVFGVTRPNLRTLVQSIARHDAQFPNISGFRTLQTFIKRSSTYDKRRTTKNQLGDEENEGGYYVMET